MHRSRLGRAVSATFSPILTAVGVMIAVCVVVLGAWFVFLIPLTIAYLFAYYTVYSTLTLMAVVVGSIMWCWYQDERKARGSSRQRRG